MNDTTATVSTPSSPLGRSLLLLLLLWTASMNPLAASATTDGHSIRWTVTPANEGSGITTEADTQLLTVDDSIAMEKVRDQSHFFWTLTGCLFLFVLLYGWIFYTGAITPLGNSLAACLAMLSGWMNIKQRVRERKKS